MKKIKINKNIGNVFCLLIVILNDYTGPQNKKKLSVLDVRDMFSNLVFTAKKESKIKIRDQMAKN